MKIRFKLLSLLLCTSLVLSLCYKPLKVNASGSGTYASWETIYYILTSMAVAALTTMGIVETAENSEEYDELLYQIVDRMAADIALPSSNPIYGSVIDETVILQDPKTEEQYKFKWNFEAAGMTEEEGKEFVYNWDNNNDEDDDDNKNKFDPKNIYATGALLSVLGAGTYEVICDLLENDSESDYSIIDYNNLLHPTLKETYAKNIVIPAGTAAWSTAQIVKWNAENLGYQSNIMYTEWLLPQGYTQKSEIVLPDVSYIIPYKDSKGNLSLVCPYYDEVTYTYNMYVKGEYDTGYTKTTSPYGNLGFVILGVNCLSTYDLVSCSCPIPFYYAEGVDPDIKKIGLGLSQDTFPEKYTVIDTAGTETNVELNELLKILAQNNVSVITQPLNDIATNQAISLQYLTDLSTNTKAQLSELTQVQTDLSTDLMTLLQTVIATSVLPQIFTLTVPQMGTATTTGTRTQIGEDWEYDYRSVLKAIAASVLAISTFFVIDFDQIKTHIVSTINDIPTFDVFEPIIGYFDYFRTAITDNYDYPVISITTPDILLPYYQQPEIILVDFEDYAKYFVWARAIISFSLYFGFGIWLIKDIKIFFSGL